MSILCGLYPEIEPFETGFLDTGDGHQVYWERVGTKGGKPAVFLHGGQWRGEQVVPAEWVALSLTRHVENIQWGQMGVYGYGFMWYPGRMLGSNGYRVIRAAGNGDQRVFILPDAKLVITVFAGNYNNFRFRTGRKILDRVMSSRR